MKTLLTLLFALFIFTACESVNEPEHSIIEFSNNFDTFKQDGGLILTIQSNKTIDKIIMNDLLIIESLNKTNYQLNINNLVFDLILIFNDGIEYKEHFKFKY